MIFVPLAHILLKRDLSGKHCSSWSNRFGFCNAEKPLSGGEFPFSGDDTSSLLRLLLVFRRFLLWWFFLCRFLLGGWSGGFGLGFRSWLIRSRLVRSRGWFCRFRSTYGFRRFSSTLGRCGSGLGRSRP